MIQESLWCFPQHTYTHFVAEAVLLGDKKASCNLWEGNARCQRDQEKEEVILALQPLRESSLQ
jgi:hypothetical protein